MSGRKDFNKGGNELASSQKGTEGTCFRDIKDLCFAREIQNGSLEAWKDVSKETRLTGEAPAPIGLRAPVEWSAAPANSARRSASAPAMGHEFAPRSLRGESACSFLNH